MHTRTIAPVGPYALARSRDFLCGFTPARGTCDAESETLRIAFRLDGTFEATGVAVREREDALEVEIHGAGDPDAATTQIARMLCLDEDARPFAAIGDRDPTVRALLERYPGFRPVCFASPWEAGVWGVLASRVSMGQAAALRRRIALAHGDTVEVDGVAIPVFPAPATILGLERVEGLHDEKLRRLSALAGAALDGRLDAARMRAGDPERVIADLERIRGVGPWTAAHILLRGGALVDLLPLGEPRLHHAVAHAYGLAAPPDDARLTEMAEAWRPFRTWTAILVTMHLARTGTWNVKARRGKRARRA